MDDRTPIYVVLAAAAVVVMLVLLYWLRSAAPEPGPEPANRREPTATRARPPRQSVTDDRPSGVGAPGPGAPGSTEPVEPTRDTPAPTADEDLVAGKEDGWEFTAADLADSDRPVYLDLGNYQAGIGDEFDVQLFLEAPALTAMTLVLRYDTELLDVVPDSAEAVGRVFRGLPLEFYVNAAEGAVGLFLARGTGLKNMLASRNEQVAVFRMRAKKEGTAVLRAHEDGGIEFTNARGALASCEVSGGMVVIR